jgi:hypothetical protein
LPYRPDGLSLTVCKRNPPITKLPAELDPFVDNL